MEGGKEGLDGEMKRIMQGGNGKVKKVISICTTAASSITITTSISSITTATITTFSVLLFNATKLFECSSTHTYVFTYLLTTYLPFYLLTDSLIQVKRGRRERGRPSVHMDEKKIRKRKICYLLEGRRKTKIKQMNNN